VRAGALALTRAVPYLGPGVVIAVVDPGVAGTRRALALEVGSGDGPRHLVGPDNGLLVWAADVLGGVKRAVVLGDSPSGSTFDGRDIFAPAAGALWQGVSIVELGAEIDAESLIRLAPPVVSFRPGVVECEVLWVDHFGNVQLSATPQDASGTGVGDLIGENLVVAVGDKRSVVLRVTSFSEVPEDGLGVLVDANGQLALAGDRSSAARTLSLRAGDTVKLVARVDSGGGPG
jgi:S-adenosylmethionine hydrolase